MRSTYFYTATPCKCLLFHVKQLLLYAITTFACWGWLEQFFVGSKQWFCPYKPDFYAQKQKQCTLMNGES
jgi:hypothetical protein